MPRVHLLPCCAGPCERVAPNCGPTSSCPGSSSRAGGRREWNGSTVTVRRTRTCPTTLSWPQAPWNPPASCCCLASLIRTSAETSCFICRPLFLVKFPSGCTATLAGQSRTRTTTTSSLMTLRARPHRPLDYPGSRAALSSTPAPLTSLLRPSCTPGVASTGGSCPTHRCETVFSGSACKAKTCRNHLPWSIPTRRSTPSAPHPRPTHPPHPSSSYSFHPPPLTPPH